jgi:hypothetical protein
MKKLWEAIKGIFGGIGADLLIDKGGDIVQEGLNDFYGKNPKACSAMVSSMHVWLDTSIEDLAAKSKTKLDDKAVKEAKTELEAFAAAKGFTLTNLDAD